MLGVVQVVQHGARRSTRSLTPTGSSGASRLRGYTSTAAYQYSHCTSGTESLKPAGETHSHAEYQIGEEHTRWRQQRPQSPCAPRAPHQHNALGQYSATSSHGALGSLGSATTFRCLSIQSG